MEIRRTEPADLDAVMDIYDRARQYMKGHGNPNQWIDGYPSRELILEDIENSNSYVCITEGETVAVFSYIFGTDPTYLKIYGGSWLNDERYGVIHRIASISHQKGVASYCIDWCFRQCCNIRIDTHEDNYIMQNLLVKNGFIRCGTIYLLSGASRIAYQKTEKSGPVHLH